MIVLYSGVISGLGKRLPGSPLGAGFRDVKRNQSTLSVLFEPSVAMKLQYAVGEVLDLTRAGVNYITRG